LDHHSGQVEEIALHNSQFLPGEVFLDEHRSERILLGFLAQFFFKAVGIQSDQSVEALDELLTVRNFFRNDIDVKGRAVVDEEFPVAVEKHPAESCHILEPDPVALRLDAESGSLKDLKKPQPQQEHNKHGDHEEGQLDQPLSQNLYRCLLKSLVSQRGGASFCKN
jgi:hypothetical protein